MVDVIITHILAIAAHSMCANLAMRPIVVCSSNASIYDRYAPCFPPGVVGDCAP